MGSPLAVLILEDSPADAALTVRELRRQGFDLDFLVVSDALAFGSAIDARSWDIILADWSLPSFSARAALSMVQSRGIDLPLMILSGSIDEDTAVEALRSGAADFLVKGKFQRLGPAIDRELRERASRAARRKAEAQVRQMQKMEAIGSLAGGIAHDFNNLLSVILSHSEMLLGDLEPADPKYLEAAGIKEAGMRAAELTRQLLAFGRRQTLAPEVLDLNVVVRGVETMLRRLVRANVELDAKLAPALGLAKVDKMQVEQVIMNLVSNASDAMPNGGKLVIETVNVDIDATSARVDLAPGPYVVLAVTDTGTGIDEATKARMFEPFFTTKERGKGTGLGLASVFGIVKQSGGSIAVDSEPGHGATFKTYFPRVAGQLAPPAPVVAEPKSARRSETVLLVDDENALRAIMKLVLTRQGYEVLAAADGAEAVRLSEGHKGVIHLLITDVVMPSMSGFEVAKRVRARRPEIKVLYVSGYAEDSAGHEDAIGAGAAFLAKPITPSLLTRRVRETLDGPVGSPISVRESATEKRSR